MKTNRKPRPVTDPKSATVSIITALRQKAGGMSNHAGWRDWYLDIATALETHQIEIIVKKEHSDV